VPGTDLRAGVATLPLIRLRALAATDATAAALVARIETDAAGADGDEASADFDAAIAELRVHDVTTRTLTEAHEWAREAVEALAPLPDGPVKQALTRFAETIVDRSK
jgi:heptaprenyl diphosphate synthase